MAKERTNKHKKRKPNGPPPLEPVQRDLHESFAAAASAPPPVSTITILKQSPPKYDKKDTVLCLMELKGEVEQENSKGDKKTYLEFLCKNPNCSKAKQKVPILQEKGKGYGNAHSHLTADLCYGATGVDINVSK